MIGPIFARELIVLPRRPRIYVMRVVYVLALLLLAWTAWLVLAGTQLQMNVGDGARFGASLFLLLASFQLALTLFFSALLVTNSVSQEKDRKTLILLLLTSLRNRELVLGKLFAALLSVAMLLLAGLPIFVLCQLFGGVTLTQIVRVFSVTLAAAFLAGSLGSTIALWREKTFQALALVFLVIVFWLGIAEGCVLLWPDKWGTLGATIASPWRAMLAAAQPELSGTLLLGLRVEWLFVLFAVVTGSLLNLLAMVYVRKWNGAEQAREQRDEPKAVSGIWSDEQSVSAAAAQAKSALNAHAAPGKKREVWSNPILWREICTWAYGKKVLIIKGAYLLLALACGLALARAVSSDQGLTQGMGTLALAPLGFLGMVLINALAVTSITNERDAKALDLLLVTDLTPREFILGKLLGVAYNTWELFLVPLIFGLLLWWNQALPVAHVVYLLLGLLVMYAFSSTVGLHSGLTYVSSRNAILVSQGVIFFLLLGVAMVVQIMISFRGSFQFQLQPFIALILGGFLGLYFSLGIRNPSPAIAMASLLTPFLTFWSISSFLQGLTLGALLPLAATYLFFVVALLVPAFHEFDVATHRGGDGD